MSNGLFSFKRLESKFSNLDFEFIFEDENSTSKQKEESDDEPYDDDYDIWKIYIIIIIMIQIQTPPLIFLNILPISASDFHFCRGHYRI